MITDAIGQMSVMYFVIGFVWVMVYLAFSTTRNRLEVVVGVIAWLFFWFPLLVILGSLEVMHYFSEPSVEQKYRRF